MFRRGRFKEKISEYSLKEMLRKITAVRTNGPWKARSGFPALQMLSEQVFRSSCAEGIIPPWQGGEKWIKKREH